jgi:hypothetical protein
MKTEKMRRKNIFIGKVVSKFEIFKSSTEIDGDRISIVWMDDVTYEEALLHFRFWAFRYRHERVSLQLVEVENNSGCCLVRMAVEIDGRPFCNTGEKFTKDNYGYK